jgi:integrase/recombinase XerD
MTPLRQRMLQDMQIRNLTRNTQLAYLQQISGFAKYFQCSPEALGPAEIRAYQVYLTNERKLAPGSLSIVAAALRFLYKVTLKRDWVDEEIPLPKKPFKLPVILSPEEVFHFLESIRSFKHRTILTTAYAAGLRISEVTRLKITDIDSQRMMLRVEQGKGQKDRYVMLSPLLLDVLRAYWKATRPTTWLFPGDRPNRPISKNAVEQACQKAHRICGIKKPTTLLTAV